MSVEQHVLSAILESQLNLPNLEQKIKTDIIPRMMKRVGRETPLTRTQIVDKIFSVSPTKPGEAIELIVGEIEVNGPNVTPTLASEVADIVYYSHQENCPDLVQDITPMLDFLGITLNDARMFCILKYETRILFGDNKDHKEIENAVLAEYLARQKNISTAKT